MDYSSMSNYQLRELCKQKKIRGYGGKNKETLLELLGYPVEPIEEVNTPPVEPQQEIQAEPIDESSEDHFEMSGPFTYIFERSSDKRPLEPTPCEGTWKILEIADTLRPHFLVFENVKNIIKHRDGQTFEKLKEELKLRGYFHRYRILSSLEKNTYLYTICLRKGETPVESSYDSDKVEEARISILIDPTLNKKYFFTNETWVLKSVNKNIEKKTFIRTHVVKDSAEKAGPPMEHAGSLSLRLCFSFDDFHE